MSICAKVYVCVCMYMWFIFATWLIYMCDIRMRNTGSFTCATWLIHMCDMIPSYVRHDAFMYVTWLMHVCAGSSRSALLCVRHNLIMCSYVRHDAFTFQHDSCICATWSIHMCHSTHSYLQHDSIICATPLIHMCAGSSRGVTPLSYSRARGRSDVRAYLAGKFSKSQP